MMLRARDTLADLTEADIRQLNREDVRDVPGHLACTITADQIRWFKPEVLGQFLLGEHRSGYYNFSGGNYLCRDAINAISLEQIEGITQTSELPCVKELEQYLMVKKIISLL